MSAAHYDGPRIPEPDDAQNLANLKPEDLHARLRAWAAGVYPGEAAVELLIGHGTWLRRRDFLTRCVIVCGPWADEPAMAGIDWSAVAGVVDPAGSIQPGEGLPASSSEMVILAVAASLAGAPLRQSLRDLIVGLDDTNSHLVVEALARAAGWHERGRRVTISGWFDADAGDQR